MKPGDLVRLKPSEKLAAPWKDYAKSETLLRVEQVFPNRGRRSVRVRPPHERNTGLRHDWFAPADLVPVAREVSENYLDMLFRLSRRNGDGR